MEYIIAHDFGTSSVKSCIFSTDGECVRTVTGKYETYVLHNSWVEQEPEDWWDVFCENNRVLTQNLPEGKIICVSFCGTYPNCIPVGEDRRPLCRALIWQDCRNGEEAEEMASMLPAEYLNVYRDRKVTVDRTAGKLLWLRRHRPEIYRKIWKVILSPSNYIVLRLTGEAYTDLRIGFSTGLSNLERNAWSDDVLQALDIPKCILPEMHKRTDIVGEITEKMAAVCHIPAGAKLVVGTGDGDSADIAVGMLKDGDGCLNGCTSASIQIINSKVKGPWLMPTSCSGAAISWMRHQLAVPEELRARETGEDPYDLINEAIAKVPAGSNGVIFLPYMAGERATRLNPDAKGSFTGVTLDTTRQDMMRAVYEGIGMNLNLILQVARDGGFEITRMPIVGGMGKSAVLRQIFSDILDIELFTFENMDVAGCAGSAVLGGIGAGIYQNEESAYTKFMKPKDVTVPDKENHKKYAEKFDLFDKLYQAQLELYPEM